MPVITPPAEPVVINNLKWAYLGQYRNGRVGPKLGKPDPYFIKFGESYRPRRGDPTQDELALARLHAGAVDILPGRSGLGKAVPKPIQNVAPRLTFSAQGAALQWPPAPEEAIQGYHIERSHTPGFPLWSFLRVTAKPVLRLTHQDMWAFEGEAVAYRVYTVREDGTLSLRAAYDGVQPPFSDTIITTTFVINGTNTSSTKLTVFENLHFRPGEMQNCVRVETGNRVLLRNCTGLTSGNFISANGGGKVQVENCLIKGKVPATKNYSAGWAFKGDYQNEFAFRNNTVRELAGVYCGQWRGRHSRDGGLRTYIQGNLFHNLHRKRSDGQGGNLAETTIVSAYKEGPRGQSNPTKTAGFTMPIGWDFAQVFNFNGSGNTRDKLPAQFFGGLEILGNFVLQEPGIGLLEDAFSIYMQGGESWDRPLAIRGWLCWGNYGNGIDGQGQKWAPGKPWNQGGQKQPAGSYTPGVTQPAGEYTFPFQSMTGGLMQDGGNYSVFAANGGFVLAEDAWMLGPGTLLSAQHGNDMRINRASVLYTGKDRSGSVAVSGDPRIGLRMDNYDGTRLVEGRQVSGLRLGIQNSVQIRPGYTAPGFGTRWMDPAFTFNNTGEDRAATAAEEQAAHQAFLLWCDTRNISLGPQFPSPAVVYT